MRLYEHEAKKIFNSVGLKTPRQIGLIRTPADLNNLEISFPAMLKAMTLIGGRGKAGGIRKVNNMTEARTAAGEILDMTIKGYPVEAALVEQAVSERAAFYAGITTNPATFNVILMASAEGGVNIEQVALENPEAILRKEFPDNAMEMKEPDALEFARFLIRGFGDDRDLAAKLKTLIAGLYSAYQKFDCRIAEINPVIVTAEGDAIAADAKIVLDDNALYRQKTLMDMIGIAEARHDVSELTRDEARARDAGFTYVDLLHEDAPKDPDKLYVGLVPGGAGYGIFSIDETVNIGDWFFDGRVVPVNFMDSGGGPSQAGVAEMFHLLMDKEIVDIIITSRFGGISSCDVFIKGLIQCFRDRFRRGDRIVPVYGRMVGTDLPSAKTFLERAKRETPDQLKDMTIIVGNQKIMADVIREGIVLGFERMETKGAGR
ncbi:hypothetical protein JXA40_03025 [bacterium]|nr:hypothetical protein [candidate division CSSED10-310 bacterium]